MEPLSTSRRTLTWMCIYPPEETETWQAKMLHLIWLTTILFTMGSSIIAVLALGYIEVLFSAMNVPAVIALIYTILNAFYLRHGIVHIFESLSDICNAYQHKDSPGFLKSADKNCEWVWSFYAKVILGGFFGNYMFSTIASILARWLSSGTIIPELLYRPYVISLPFDQNTPLGYFGLTLYCNMFGQTYLFGSGVFLLLFISLCWYHRAFSELFQHFTRKTANSYQSRKQNLVEIIDFHNTIKDFFEKTLEVYTYFIMIQLLSSMAFLAISAFQLDLQTRHPDSSIMMLLVNSSVGVYNLFIYCYFGKEATESYEKMTDYLIETNWYEYPNDLQKYLILMIANTHTPVVYHGFNIAVLDLATFASMIKATYSYYMMFKTMN